MNGAESANGSAASLWTRPIRIADYLSAVIGARNLRPPDAPGVYVLSERPWRGFPDKHANLIYAGQAPYLRYRIGQLFCDLLGFTGDDPADGEAYEHRGGHVLWHRYCVARGVEPIDLYFAWCAPCKCLDCAVGKLLEITSFSAAKASWRACCRHIPPLDLSDNCSPSPEF
jgi:hypothetical protein